MVYWRNAFWSIQSTVSWFHCFWTCKEAQHHSRRAWHNICIPHNRGTEKRRKGPRTRAFLLKHVLPSTRPTSESLYLLPTMRSNNPKINTASSGSYSPLSSWPHQPGIKPAEPSAGHSHLNCDSLVCVNSALELCGAWPLWMSFGSPAYRPSWSSFLGFKVRASAYCLLHRCCAPSSPAHFVSSGYGLALAQRSTSIQV